VSPDNAASRRPAESHPIPAKAGIGLRHPHVSDLIEAPRRAAWIEVHAENYAVAGGPRPAELERLRRDLPLSVHGVGLSLGSAEGLDSAHLAALKAVVDRFQPALVSEHVSWSVADGVYLNDLLPLPLTEAALDIFCRNVDAAQTALKRPILVENPSTYLDFAASRIPEPEFIAAIVRRTGCGLLLDVNNIHVSAANRGFEPDDYLARLPLHAVGEIHVAGHATVARDGETVLIDDHGSAVIPAVWRLLDRALAATGPVPVLVEWDTAIPPLETLLGEAAKAEARLAAAGSGRRAHAA
jgi:uncharacterized protein